MSHSANAYEYRVCFNRIPYTKLVIPLVCTIWKSGSAAVGELKICVPPGTTVNAVRAHKYSYNKFIHMELISKLCCNKLMCVHVCDCVNNNNMPYFFEMMTTTAIAKNEHLNIDIIVV